MRDRRSPTYLERRQHEDQLHRTSATSVRPAAEDVFWLDPVDDILNDPPGAPNEGDRYIVGCSPTGAWVGHEAEIAEWNGEAWDFTVPMDGSTTWVKQRGYFVTFDDSGDASGFIADVGDEAFWVPHHLIDTAHMIFPQGIMDRLTTPPGSPGLFDAYLVTATATGAWAGYEDYIAVSVCDKTSGARVWVYIEAEEGQLVWVNDENMFYLYDGTAWVNFPEWVANNHDLEDIRDVILTSIADQDLLWWDAGSMTWINVTDDALADVIASLTNLTELADVTGASSPTTCEVLLGNGSGQWTKGQLDVSCLTGSFDCDDIVNASGVTGATVCDALDNLDSRITTNTTNITNLSNTIGALDCDDIANASGVSGATVCDALDNLNSAIGSIGGGGSGAAFGYVPGSGSGTIASGTGWSVATNTTGEYVLTLSSASLSTLSDLALVVVPLDVSGAEVELAIASGTTVDVTLKNSGGSLTSYAWMFIAYY